MELFLYEHLSALSYEGDTETGSMASLAREGEAMLRALLEDCCQLPGLVVRFAWSDRSPPPPTPPNAFPVSIDSGGEVGSEFENWVRRTDATLLIAPELGDELGTLAARVEACDGFLLGPSAEAIRAAADKLELPARLDACAVPALAAVPLDESATAWPPHFPTPWVVKPRFGAGATAVELITDRSTAPRQSDRELIVAPHVEGHAVSVAVLTGPKQVLPLAPCSQHVTGGTPQIRKFTYEGGVLPLPTDQVERAQELAIPAVAAIPQLRGFVGVDIILAIHSADDVVVEINPRLTTSYLGLRALTSANLAGLWLAIMEGRPVPTPTWHPRSIKFFTDGRVEVLERC